MRKSGPDDAFKPRAVTYGAIARPGKRRKVAVAVGAARVVAVAKWKPRQRGGGGNGGISCSPSFIDVRRPRPQCSLPPQAIRVGLHMIRDPRFIAAVTRKRAVDPAEIVNAEVEPRGGTELQT
jgi:hypothetical protein